MNASIPWRADRQQHWQAQMEELARGHRFTAEHHLANRAGRVHPEQRRKAAFITPFRRVFTVLWMLLSPGAAIGGFVASDAIGRPHGFLQELGVYGLPPAGIVFALWMIWSGISFWRGETARRHAYELGRVEVWEGQVRKDSFHYKRTHSYWYVAGPHRFGVGESAWEAVTNWGWYRIFHCGGEILSIEPLSASSSDHIGR
jgi:hypothetical protein